MDSIVHEYSKPGSFPIFLIDTGRGNSFAVTFNVQVGSWHDDPQAFPGRAHLWEHIIHLGSKKFPGATCFDEEVEKMGASYNAYTSLNRTFYYGSVHENQLEKMIELLGSTISSPNADEESFGRERLVVMNEVLEYQRSNQDALDAALHILLFPDAHPLKMFCLGTQEKLKSVKRADLFRLYSSNYQPEFSQVIIAGNFSKMNEAKRESILQSIEKNFIPPKLQEGETPGVKRSYPSIVYDQNENKDFCVEVETADEQKLLSILWEIPPEIVSKNFEFTELLLELLNLEMESSISDRFEKLGWITSISFNWQYVNDLHFVSIYCELTDEGAQKRNEFTVKLFEEISRLVETLGDEQIFHFAKEAICAHLEEAAHIPKKAADLFGGYLEFLGRSDLVFDLKRYRDLSADEFQSFASQIFRADSYLISYLGSDVKAEQELVDFNRKVKLIRNREWRSQLNEAIHRKFSGERVPIQLPELGLNLGFAHSSSENKLKPGLVYRSSEFLSSIGETLEASQNIGLIVSLHFSNESVQEFASLKLFAECFHDAYRTKLGYLEALNIFDDLRAFDSDLILSIKTKPLQLEAAFSEILKDLQSYEPKEAEFVRAKESLFADIESQQQGFSASIAQKELLDRIYRDRFSNDELKLVLEKLSHSDFLKTWMKMKLRFHLYMGMSGCVDPQIESDFSDLAVRHFRPTLEFSREEELFCLETSERKTEFYNLSQSKEEDAFGICRACIGPETKDLEFSKILFLVHLFAFEIFRLNRTQNELGYIHSADIFVNRGQSVLLFYGQTNGIQSLNKTVEGWREIIRRYTTNQIDFSFLEKFREGLVRGREVLPHTELEYASRRFKAWMNFNDPRAIERINQEVKSFDLSESRFEKEWLPLIHQYFGEDVPFSQLIAKHQKLEEQALKQDLNFL